MQEEKGAVVARLRVPFRDLRILDPMVRAALSAKVSLQLSKFKTPLFRYSFLHPTQQPSTYESMPL